MDDATRGVGRPEGGPSRTAASGAAQVDPSLPQEVDARAREIRAEIAQTRGEMSETIEAIQERLRPGTIVANATETVRQATTEKVKQMANTAGDAADRVMHNSFMDTVRENPVPAAMIGIGAAWLLMKGRSEGGRYDSARSRYGTDHNRSAEYGGYDWKTRTAAGTGEAYDSLRGRSAVEAGTGLSELGSDAASRASEYAAEVRQVARRTTRRAQNSFDRVLRDNPLALGAAATLVGAAIGMSLPATEAENELMGDARDTVVERARGAANEAAERVKSAAEQVTDAAARASEPARPDATRSRPYGSV